MTQTEAPASRSASDEAAVLALHRTFDAQRAAFRANRTPSRADRQGHLEALAGMMLSYRHQIRQALADDFSVHPAIYSDLIEIVSVPSRAAYAISRLDEWMADDERPADPALFGTARAYVRYQPKGVVGNIVPWNFPFDVGIGPLVEMLAAGNRVIVKPSEYTPACAELLAEMLSRTFEPDHVTTAVGGLELAKEFSILPWDHLLFTGSTEVGRAVAVAAARNLVPTTLELGGKCPAIVLDDAVDERTVESILGTKLMKNGQMCIAPDHVYVPRARMQDFVELARRYVEDTVPGHSRGPNCTGIISTRHLDRLLSLQEEARAAGCEVVELEQDGRVDWSTRQMPLILVLDPAPGLGLMREEIFGPILPVLPYDDLDDAVDRFDASGRPLAVYVFGRDHARTQSVLARTTTGGACVDLCAAQGALPSLGFGGSGRSGNGRHHGVEGFREFSNARGIVERGEGDLAALFYAPYDQRLEGVLAGAFPVSDG